MYRVDVLSVDLQVFLVRFTNAFGWTTSVSCSLDEGQDHFLLFFSSQKLASTFDKNKKVKCEERTHNQFRHFTFYF